VIRCGWMLTDLRGGGAERLPIVLGPEMCETQLTIILLKDDIEHELPVGAPKVSSLSPGDTTLTRSFAPILLRAVRLARDMDVIVAGLEWAPTYFAVAVGKLARKPVVATVHSDLLRFHSRESVSRIEWLALKRTLRACRAVVAVSEDARRSLIDLGVASRTISVIPNPAPRWKTNQKRGHGQPRILTVGALRWFKGIDVILTAAAMLGDEPFVWQIAGQGEEGDTFRRDAQALGLDGKIQFVGFQPDIRQLYSEADLFVLASRVEGSPLVLAEAMAAGLPIVATRCSSAVEELLDGGAGMLVPVDDPNALAAAVRTLLSDADLATQLGNTASERIRDWDPGLIAGKYEQLLRSVVNNLGSTGLTSVASRLR
jgi:glycosyltransferase involved in cell wall biosynthesis